MDISDDGKAAVCRFGHERSDMSDGGKLQCSSGQCSGLDMRGRT